MPPHPCTPAAAPQHLSTALPAAPWAQPPSASANTGGCSRLSFITVKINKHTKQQAVGGGEHLLQHRRADAGPDTTLISAAACAAHPSTAAALQGSRVAPQPSAPSRLWKPQTLLPSSAPKARVFPSTKGRER